MSRLQTMLERSMAGSRGHKTHPLSRYSRAEVQDVLQQLQNNYTQGADRTAELALERQRQQMELLRELQRIQASGQQEQQLAQLRAQLSEGQAQNQYGRDLGLLGAREGFADRRQTAEQQHDLRRLGVSSQYDLERQLAAAQQELERLGVAHGYNRDLSSLGHEQTLERDQALDLQQRQRMGLSHELGLNQLGAEYQHRGGLAELQNQLNMGRDQAGYQHDMRRMGAEYEQRGGLAELQNRLNMGRDQAGYQHELDRLGQQHQNRLGEMDYGSQLQQESLYRSQQHERAQAVQSFMAETAPWYDKLKPEARMQFNALRGKIEKLQQANLNQDELASAIASLHQEAQSLAHPNNWMKHAPGDEYVANGLRFRVNQDGKHEELGVADGGEVMKGRATTMPIFDQQGNVVGGVPGYIDRRENFKSVYEMLPSGGGGGSSQVQPQQPGGRQQLYGDPKDARTFLKSWPMKKQETAEGYSQDVPMSGDEVLEMMRRQDQVYSQYMGQSGQGQPSMEQIGNSLIQSIPQGLPEGEQVASGEAWARQMIENLAAKYKGDPTNMTPTDRYLLDYYRNALQQFQKMGAGPNQ